MEVGTAGVFSILKQAKNLSKNPQKQKRKLQCCFDHFHHLPYHAGFGRLPSHVMQEATICYLLTTIEFCKMDKTGFKMISGRQ